MDRLHEIIGHLREEEYDAVLYGVMLRFLKRKAKEIGVNDCELLLNIDEENKTIDIHNEYGGYSESVNPFNEA